MKQRWLLALVLLLSACRSQTGPTPIAAPEVHPELQNFPLYPGAKGWMIGFPGVDTPEGHEVYSYPVEVFQLKTLVEFYEEEMPTAGWELLQKSDENKTKSAGLMFTKSKTVAHIQMIPWAADSYLVYVVFYDDPVFDELQK